MSRSFEGEGYGERAAGKEGGKIGTCPPLFSPGMSLLTKLKAPMIEFSPMVTPGITTLWPHISRFFHRSWLILMNINNICQGKPIRLITVATHTARKKCCLGYNWDIAEAVRIKQILIFRWGFYDFR
jgi:hypothetical protein